MTHCYALANGYKACLENNLILGTKRNLKVIPFDSVTSGLGIYLRERISNVAKGVR